MMKRALLLLLSFSTFCRAQHPQIGTQDIDANTTAPGEARADRLSGDWHGLRPRLESAGVTFAAAYRNELVGIVHGGTQAAQTDVGELYLGAQLDTAKKLGWRGGLVRFLVTRRHGTSVADKAGVSFLLAPQELFGRGEVFRLTELSIQQTFSAGHLIFKLGRFGNEDFASMDCDFTNLSLCGPPPANLNSQFWYISPEGIWTGWAKLKNDRTYFQLGLSEDNRKNIDQGFFLSRKGAQGILTNAEVGLTPQWLGADRPGRYRVGAYFLSSCDPDVRSPTNGMGLSSSDAVFPLRCGQTGEWMEMQQQLTGKATQDKTSGRITRVHGVEVFGSYFRGDPRTSKTLDQFTAGVYYCGPFRVRPNDQLAVGFAANRYNSRVNGPAAQESSGPLSQGTEHVLEAYYGVHLLPGVLARPGIQFVPNPNGQSASTKAVGLNLRVDVNF